MKTNYYEKILKIRNKQFPPVLELGCNVGLKSEGYIRINYTLEPNGYLSVGEIGVVGHNFRIYYSYKNLNVEYQREWFEILGKPVSLRDVLRLIEKKYNSEDFGIKTNGKFYEIYLDDKLFELDLSKDIKSQNKEVLKKVYNLIK